jgi:predicted enzyme related to lactoylglutathione lyase
MPRPIHFEIGADNPDSLVAFYTNVFGWKIQKWEGPMPYWLVTTGSAPEPGIDGGIFKRPHVASQMNTVGVDSVDQYVAKVTSGGGKVVAPKMPIPGVGYLAYCSDPDGNVFGLMQRDPGAK